MTIVARKIIIVIGAIITGLTISFSVYIAVIKYNDWYLLKNYLSGNDKLKYVRIDEEIVFKYGSTNGRLVTDKWSVFVFEKQGIQFYKIEPFIYNKSQKSN